MVEVGFGRPHGQLSAKFADEDQRQPTSANAVKVFRDDAALHVKVTREKMLEEKLEPGDDQRHVVLGRVVEQEAIGGEMLGVPPTRRQEFGIMEEA